MSRPWILEVCAGEGGSTAGLQDAGWRVVAVDDDPNRLKRNPSELKICADAFDVLYDLQHTGRLTIDGQWIVPVATWAGWPCQGYSAGTRALRAAGGQSRHKRLIAAGREAQQSLGLPYVIENVEGARRELVNPVLLCGRQFGLAAEDEDGTPLVLDRHRLFESDVLLMVPPHPPHDRSLQVAGVYGGARKDKDEARNVRRGGYVPPAESVQQALLGGVGWMTQKGRQLCIPPAYARHIGEQLLTHIREEAA